jgi:hypothetical protein
VCPEGQFVSKLSFDNGVTNIAWNGSQWNDHTFIVTCGMFDGVPVSPVGGQCRWTEQGAVTTSTRSPIIWPTDTVMLDDNEKTCSCDEYLSGVTSFVTIDQTGTGVNQKQPQRM